MLAARGLGSRRKIETLIAAGRITVDGVPATLGQRVSGHESIVVEGHRVRPPSTVQRVRVIAYNKPPNELVTRDDPERRDTVFTRLPALRTGRWIAIGRLDFTTSGLLLFTNAGELADRLMHPRYEVERRYAVRVIGGAESEGAIERLRRGVRLEDGFAKFDRLEPAGGEGANRWYAVSLHEGRNREVRRMFEAVGLTVSRLIRTGFGPIDLPRDLPRGRWRELEPPLVRRLSASLAPRPPAP